MMSDQGASATGRRAAFGFIFATAIMNSLSFGIMIPVLPNLIKSFMHGDAAHATAQAATWAAVFATTWGLMQFFVGPILGQLSDRFGRRPVMLISIFGLGVDFLFMAFAPTLAWLYVGRVLNGATAASFSTANAYVADVTPPERRARNFGLMGSAFSFGFLIGPALGGALTKLSLHTPLFDIGGLRLPFIVAAGLCLVNWVYGFVILPESLPPERRINTFKWAKANPVGSLIFLRDHGELLGLAGVNFLFQLAHNVLPAIFVLYAGYRYGWGPDIVGLTMMGSGALGIIVQVFLVGPVVARIGERGAVLLGGLAGTAGFTIYGLASVGWVYLAAMPVFALMSFLPPGLIALMSRRVEPQAQGQLQGANQSLQGISSVIGPSLFGLTFAWAVDHDAILHMPGLPILMAASLIFAAFLIALRTARPVVEPVVAPAPAE
jgi:DHA1 family tetracycline resistance protein-like MFS transporter